MLAEVAGEALQSRGQLQPLLQAARCWWCWDGNALSSVSPARCAGSSFTYAERAAVPAGGRRSRCDFRYVFKGTLQTLGQHGAAVHAGVFFGHGGYQGFGDAECASHIAQRTARPVAGHDCRNGGALTPVFGVDVLDHFFAPLVLKVHVNIRGLVALAADKALKQHAHARRVHLGHAQAVAHRRIRRRPASLAQDALAAGEAHDVVHRQKIHLVTQLGNQRQLVFHLRAHVLRDACGVAHPCAFFGVLAQGLRRGVAGQHGLQGIVVAEAVQREIAALRHHQGVRQMLRIEQGRQARAASQMPFRVGLQAPPTLRQRQT